MNITQGLHRATQQHPGAVATVCGSRTRTHAESLDHVSRLAAALHRLGLRTGDRTAILSLNSDYYHEYIAATLATSSAGHGGPTCCTPASRTHACWSCPTAATSLTSNSPTSSPRR
jgi:acyl-CoA synthetase (AMP-forming)/AMP-acid ligase II